MSFRSLNLRFKEPRKEGEEYEAKTKELSLELEVEILRATTEEELVNSKGGEGDLLGKRIDRNHTNGDSMDHDTTEKKIKDE